MEIKIKYKFVLNYFHPLETSQMRDLETSKENVTIHFEEIFQILFCFLCSHFVPKYFRYWTFVTATELALIYILQDNLRATHPNFHNQLSLTFRTDFCHRRRWWRSLSGNFICVENELFMFNTTRIIVTTSWRKEWTQHNFCPMFYTYFCIHNEFNSQLLEA